MATDRRWSRLWRQIVLSCVSRVTVAAPFEIGLSVGPSDAGLPACWQPLYAKDVCCARSDLTSFGDRCHRPFGTTNFLRPSIEANLSTGDDAAYQEAFFRQGVYNTNTFADCRTSWLGVTTRQPSQDLIVFQQLMYRLRPQLVIETGSYRGGLAYFLATLFHLMGEDDARIITVDMVDIEYHEKRRCSKSKMALNRKVEENRRKVGQLRRDRLWKQHVRQISGYDSTSPEVFKLLQDELRLTPRGAAVFVTLDSDHMSSHVWNEILVYAPLVSVGSYLVVQDAILSWARPGTMGSMDAALRLVEGDEDLRKKLGTFVWDRSVEVLGYTGHMYLRRIA